MSSLFSPFIVALAGIASLTVAGIHGMLQSRVRWARTCGILGILGAGLLAAYSASLFALPPRSTINGQLSEGGTPLRLPAQAAAESLWLRAELPHVSPGQSAEVSFLLHVRDEATGDELLNHESLLEEHWVSGRAGKMRTQSLVVNPEERVDLPAESRGQALLVSVDELRGSDSVSVGMAPAPPSVLVLVLIFGLLGGLAALGDRVDPRRLTGTYFVGILAGFSLVAQAMVTPDGPKMAAAIAWITGAVVGLPVAAMLRSVVGKLLGGSGRPPGRPDGVAGGLA